MGVTCLLFTLGDANICDAIGRKRDTGIFHCLLIVSFLFAALESACSYFWNLFIRSPWSSGNYQRFIRMLLWTLATRWAMGWLSFYKRKWIL